MKQILLTLLFISALNTHAQIPNTLTSTDKVYGLSKFWQEVNYNFVYLDRVNREMWDSAYKECISKVQATENDYEYYRELQRFCALLKDGHTNVYFPRGIGSMNTLFGEYRLFIENINGKAIVVRTNLSKKDEIPLGSEIIQVNGKSTQKYIDENVAPYISSSTDYVLKDWSILNLLMGLEGETYNIKIKKPNNQIIELSLTHKRTQEKEVYPPFDFDRKLLDFKWLNNQIAYVALNSFDDKKIDSLFVQKLPELYKAKALIIDLRNNRGGSTSIGRAIMSYLTDDNVLYGSKSTTRLHIPAYKAWGTHLTPNDTLYGKPEWGMTKEEATKRFLIAKDKYYYNFPYEVDTIKPDCKKIVVPTVLLIGHNTASAAEDFLIYADNQKHMTKIGENSFGSTGQPFMFDLPGGGSARICTKKDTYPDGREFVGYGVKPDIEVKSTLTDYLDKKDPVLDKAIEYLKEKLK